MSKTKTETSIHPNDKYGFGSLEIGEFIIIKDGDLTNAKEAAYRYAKRNGIKLSCRKHIPNGLKIQRTA